MKTFSVLTIVFCLSFSIYQGCKKEPAKQPNYCFSQNFIPHDSVVIFAATSLVGDCTCPDTMKYVYKGKIAVIKNVNLFFEAVIISKTPLSTVYSSSTTKPCLFTRQSLASALQ
jgi:hypothetical protein